MDKVKLALAVTVVALALGAGGCKNKPTDKAGGADDKTAMKDARPATMGEDMRPVARKRPAPPRPRLKASDPEALKVLDAALQAHGGQEALQKKTAVSTTEAKGKFYGQPYQGRTHWKAPDKMVMDIHSMGAVMGYVGKGCWTKMHEVVLDCPASERKVSSEMNQVTHWSLLYPLKAKGLSVQKAPAVKVNGAETVAISVRGPSSPLKVTFAFYKKTNLLASISYRGTWSMGKVGRMQSVVLAHKKVDGVQVPAKTVMSFNGRIIIEEELTKVTLGKTDETVFSRPKQVAFGKGMQRKIHGHWAAWTLHKGDYRAVGATLGKLMGFLAENKLDPMGPPVMIMVKMGKTPGEHVTEVRMAVAPPRTKVAKTAGFGIKKVGDTLHALMYYKGPYDQVGPQYQALRAYIKKSKLKPAGPPYMVGLSDPRTTKPADLLSRLSFPVKK